MADGDCQERTPAPESRDIAVRPVLLTAGAIAATLALVLGAVAGLFALWRIPAGTGANGPLDFRPASPVLQSAPQAERRAYFAEKERQLQTYGWVDRQRGIARIPIKEAKRILATAGGKP